MAQLAIKILLGNHFPRLSQRLPSQIRSQLVLFLVLFNDFPSFSNFFKFILFAEDSVLSCGFENNANTSASAVLSNELSRVFSWNSANKIKVNTKKFKLFNFSYRSVSYNKTSYNKAREKKIVRVW